MAESSVVVVGDFAYRALVHRRGAKAPEEAWFRETAPFSVPVPGEADAVAAPSATIRNAEGHEWRYRSGPRGLLRAGAAPAALASTTPERTVAYRHEDRSAFPMGRIAPRPSQHAANDRPLLRANVIRSGREAALAHTADLSARSLVADGVVWHPADQPVLTVSHGPNGTIPVDYAPAESLTQGQFPFHVCDLDAALAHAAWVGANPLRHMRPDAVTPPPHAPEIVSAPDRDAFLLLAAGRILSRVTEASHPEDFARLPVGILAAWVRFRTAAEAVAAGSIDAVAPAYEALAEMFDAAPPIAVLRFGRDETAMERIRSYFEEPVRHWRCYLSAMAPAPAPEDDLRAIASLSR